MAVFPVESITTEVLREWLAKIAATRIGVIGDFGLDVYWFLDPSASEESLETGLPTQPVAEQRTALGGAGNVAQNLRALGCRRVEVFGARGDDPWGREMARWLEEVGADTTALLVETDGWQTTAYVKPHLRREEQSRLDFGNFNHLTDDTADRLVGALAARLPELDAVIVNQQMRQGIHTARLRERLAALIAAHPAKIFIVDSRHYSDAYPGAYLKINDREATARIGVNVPADARVRREDALAAARALQPRTERAVLVTRGARGVVVCEGDEVAEVPGIQILGATDPVGAGDALLAATTAALAAGAPAAVAAVLGNLAASITVAKLRQTGTASPAEILEAGAHADYVYRPELAEDLRRIQLVEGTDFERTGDREPPRRITHAVFDHDGTISALREGWERIMEPMMIRAILGPKYETADESLYHRVAERVAEFIDKSTGVQTLVQMQGLVEMVREAGCVPPGEILDAAGYKRIYNEQLLTVVRDRVARLRRGELDVADHTLKNAVAFLHALHAAGVKLYLASGTDQDDLAAEAEALGYAALFAGRIHGAVGDVAREAKRVVLDRLLAEIGDARGLVTFGDGPVEIRETHRRGGYAVGVASDEVRRWGVNLAKRTRLVRAGADLVIPDFSQFPQLLRYLTGC